MRGCRKILIAVNGCKDPLYHGLKLASDEKTWITVIKVVPPYKGDLDLTGIKNIRDVLASESKKAISEIDNIAEAERALIKTRIEEGEAHKKIIEVAHEERCDIIIMGTPR
ncbi:MAG: universal stress protein [Nitrospirae bacterium]|nr:universal stress protein [Nitrospirota bacterium]